MNKIKFNKRKVLSAINVGLTGMPTDGTAIVGPTKEAWYGKLHEFGLGKFPARPFMRPALAKARAEFPLMFKNLIGAPIPALMRAAALVERIAKASMKKGGGFKKEHSAPPDPPHVQTGTLRNSIKHAITKV